MTQNPAGIKGTLLSFGLIVAIVGIAYFISASHSVQIPDLANNSVFDRGATVLTETSILVTYVAIVAAIVTTVVTEHLNNKMSGYGKKRKKNTGSKS